MRKFKLTASGFGNGIKGAHKIDSQKYTHKKVSRVRELSAFLLDAIADNNPTVEAARLRLVVSDAASFRFLSFLSLTFACPDDPELPLLMIKSRSSLRLPVAFVTLFPMTEALSGMSAILLILRLNFLTFRSILSLCGCGGELNHVVFGGRVSVTGLTSTNSPRRGVVDRASTPAGASKPI